MLSARVLWLARVLEVCIGRDTEAAAAAPVPMHACMLPLPLPLPCRCMHTCRDVDIDVNPSKEKHLTNVRSVTADEKMVMPPPRQMTLEEAIG